VERAAFLARLAAWQPSTSGGKMWAAGHAWPDPVERWETEALFAVCPDDGNPALIFDITSTWEAKAEALNCYASQFARQEGRRATWINDASFLKKIERRARTWGRRGGTEFGEALCSVSFPVNTDMPDERWSR
jgi:LmbE family N-acetylglucosaminyl deacetylase